MRKYFGGDSSNMSIVWWLASNMSRGPEPSRWRQFLKMPLTHGIVSSRKCKLKGNIGNIYFRFRFCKIRLWILMLVFTPCRDYAFAFESGSLQCV